MGLHLLRTTSKDERPVDIRCALQDSTARTADASPEFVHCSAHGVPNLIELSELEAHLVNLFDPKTVIFC